MDQSRPGNPYLEFFGQPARTNTSFAAIWRRCPAPIIPGYIVRHEFGRHTVHFLPEVTLDQTENEEEDILRHSRIMNGVIEGVVRQHPEQYFWMHNRWK